ncbi:hypothetical protein BGZ98_004913 [Dissophora globulifera]|nr:hypothetical protein BGZ98_004913 [Dissophora globulifera]
MHPHGFTDSDQDDSDTYSLCSRSSIALSNVFNFDPLDASPPATAASHSLQIANVIQLNHNTLLAQLDKLEQKFDGLMLSSAIVSPAAATYRVSTAESASAATARHSASSPTQDTTVSSTPISLISVPSPTVLDAKTSLANLLHEAQVQPKDITSPHREVLKAKIEFVKKTMIDLELQPETTSLRVPRGACKVGVRPPPPANPCLFDDDVYILWTRSHTLLTYKEKLYELVMRLRKEEENERKALRDRYKLQYVNEDSSHRRHIRSKIDAVKKAITAYYPQFSVRRDLPDLPQNPYSVNLDLILCWFLWLSDYSGCRGRQFTASSYMEELGWTIQALQAEDEEERQYIVKKMTGGY